MPLILKIYSYTILTTIYITIFHTYFRVLLQEDMSDTLFCCFLNSVSLLYFFMNCTHMIFVNFQDLLKINNPHQMINKLQNLEEFYYHRVSKSLFCFRDFF
jgi:hypothetical protein